MDKLMKQTIAQSGAAELVIGEALVRENQSLRVSACEKHWQTGCPLTTAARESACEADVARVSTNAIADLKLTRKREASPTRSESASIGRAHSGWAARLSTLGARHSTRDSQKKRGFTPNNNNGEPLSRRTHAQSLRGSQICSQSASRIS